MKSLRDFKQILNTKALIVLYFLDRMIGDEKSQNSYSQNIDTTPGQHRSHRNLSVFDAESGVQCVIIYLDNKIDHLSQMLPNGTTMHSET